MTKRTRLHDKRHGNGKADSLVLPDTTIPMRKIIVPTDFSENAMHAATCGAAIAARSGAAIFLLHAMDGATDPILEPITLDTAYLEKYTREEFERLRSVKQRIGEQYPGPAIELRLARGLAGEAILSFSEKQRADLIVMGAHGGGCIKEIFIGSVAADVIAHSRIPVIAVPQGYTFHEPDSLLLATKRFEEDKSMFKGLIAIAETFGARIEVASFVHELEIPAAEYIDITWHLDHYIDYLQHSFPHIEFNAQRLEGDDLQGSIEQYVSRRKIGMLAVFNHPRSLIDRLCRRNNTRNTVFHSKIPVLVLPGA
jgi:nucleotide-binding universal stress UspA family protein